MTRSQIDWRKLGHVLVFGLLLTRTAAADDVVKTYQDPAFKDVFYHEILRELRELGKTVIVISHDDRYFHVADRIVRLENGRMLAFAAAGRVKADSGDQAIAAV